MQVIFSTEATDTLLGIVSYIEEEWNDEAADKFIKKAYKVIDSIASQPYIFQATQIEGVRKAVITKQTSVVYKVNSDFIEILFFWDNRQEIVF